MFLLNNIQNDYKVWQKRPTKEQSCEKQSNSDFSIMHLNKNWQKIDEQKNKNYSNDYDWSNLS